MLGTAEAIFLRRGSVEEIHVVPQSITLLLHQSKADRSARGWAAERANLPSDRFHRFDDRHAQSRAALEKQTSVFLITSFDHNRRRERERRLTSANLAPSARFTGCLASSSTHRSILFPTRTITQSSSTNSWQTKRVTDDRHCKEIYLNAAHPSSNSSKGPFRRYIVEENNPVGFAKVLFGQTSKSSRRKTDDERTEEEETNFSWPA